ncbi:MAG TPA: redox-sensitive transcriptional activator SoxR [Alphaproteobacteria bacterium]|nr:redox-sensitive transcriptional activator SoxR [Alphaproteobacteria bacterium]HAJ47990.1 redox-sensitive transcriptional activator SoxR [Alphaproteobacteria bacterium]
MLKPTDVLSIGDLAARTGLSVSAIRFYEAQGLITPQRSPGGQRRFLRADIRRLSFILIVQRLGYTVTGIREALRALPENRTPTQKDWTALSSQIRGELTERIETITRLRDRLDGCIGCGCLSLKHCALYNPQDQLCQDGPGPSAVLRRSR